MERHCGARNASVSIRQVRWVTSPGRVRLGDFPRVVCRNRFRLLFFGLDDGIYALEEPVQNLLQSGAGALLLRGLEEALPESLQLFVSHCTSINCNKDTAARTFLSWAAGRETVLRTFSYCTDAGPDSRFAHTSRNIGDTRGTLLNSGAGLKPLAAFSAGGISPIRIPRVARYDALLQA